ncbi:hypothetical protein CTAYLR_005020 [Chrysophaeum taylorii]|uniref:Uncharacterized protein n=1 Tax=Chrysophaeum taylorii TaxID=2483200 RepID=A0AAD7UB88_9STRA|nr:hypothetical protein CTAYLR_005020 [Chrysophaeum taylorii]
MALRPTLWGQRRPEIPTAITSGKDLKSSGVVGNDNEPPPSPPKKPPKKPPRLILAKSSSLPAIQREKFLPAIVRTTEKQRPATCSLKLRRTARKKSCSSASPTRDDTPDVPECQKLEGLSMGGAFADGEWENELARHILILYGSAMKSGEDIRGADVDFAVDADAVAAYETNLDVSAAQHEVNNVIRKKNASFSKRKKKLPPQTDDEPGKRVFKAAPVQASRVHPIWFLGSGSLCAEWSALGEDEPFLMRLGALEEAGQYLVYVDAVQASLSNYAQQLDERPGELFSRLWRQLVVTANVFGIKCVDQRRHADALELLKRAQLLSAAPEHLTRAEMAELHAFIDDSHAYYYYKRAKPNAALMFATRAMRVHVKLAQWPHVCKAHLHSATILSRMRRHPEAVRCLGQVLYLVRTGKLDLGGGAPHKLCMVAVCYHNLAVEQLLLNHVAEAAVSAQNARRLARLCLSYSNRWLHNFETTHQCATEQLAAMGRTLGAAPPR